MKNDPRKQFIALPVLDQERTSGRRPADSDSKNKQYHNQTHTMDTVTTTQTKDLHDANQANLTNRPFITPEVNIFETKHSYVLEAELPGVSKDSLEITLEGNE